MSFESPPVSVIITTYYRNEKLMAAIQSCLNQTHDNVEVIVIDDSGERYAEPVVDTFEDVAYIGLEENRGHVVARNRGVEEVSGEVIQFLDDDDVLHQEKFERQLPLLSDDIGVAYCGVHREGNPTRPRPLQQGTELERALANDFPCCITSAMLISRPVVEAVTPFPDMPGASDSFMRIEFARHTQFDFVDEVLVEKGVGEDAISLSPGKYQGYKVILERFSDLYASHPPYVERSMRASLHRKSAEIALDGRWWSSRAILDFTLSSIYGRDLKAGALAILSLFGTPGVNVGTRLFMALHPNRTSELPVWARV